MSRYRIVEQPDGRWVITDGSDDDPKIWHGSHWIYRDQCPVLTSFASREQAERHAVVVFGDQEVTHGRS
jgi:hypothetical protein